MKKPDVAKEFASKMSPGDFKKLPPKVGGKKSIKERLKERMK